MDKEGTEAQAREINVEINFLLSAFKVAPDQTEKDRIEQEIVLLNSEKSILMEFLGKCDNRTGEEIKATEEAMHKTQEESLEKKPSKLLTTGRNPIKLNKYTI